MASYGSNVSGSVMPRTPPWAWPLWGPWPSDSPSPQGKIPEHEKIQAIAAKLAERRPWCKAEENWIDAERELQSPFLLKWRPCLLRWLGASDKSGWEWIEFLVKISIPLTIAVGGWLFSHWSSYTQNMIAEDKQKDEVLSVYIKEIKSMLLDKNIAKEARRSKSDARGVARALTLTALAQLKGEESERRSQIFIFLKETDFQILGGSNEEFGANFYRYDLRGTNISFTNLARAQAWYADLRGASAGETNLSRALLWDADLRGAFLIKTNLSEAQLRNADFRGAHLIMANLRGADLENVRWDKETQWPGNEAFVGAKNIPKALKKELGLN
jgi:uncharacterized protein YjbI with pentapeptide repeats